MARYYPGGSRTPGSRNYDPDPVQGTLEENSVSRWLYGDWDENKYNQFKQLYGVPLIREYFDYLLDRRADQEYMEHNQIDYTDIHDPRKLSQTQSAARLYGRAYEFISDNVKRLYK